MGAWGALELSNIKQARVESATAVGPHQQSYRQQTDPRDPSGTFSRGLATRCALHVLE